MSFLERDLENVMNELWFFVHIVWVGSLAFYCRHKSAEVQTTLMVVYAILGNLMVLKQMSLFGLQVTTADVYAVGVILVLNYIRESYDDKAVHQAMVYSFAGLALLALAAYFQVSYEALPGDKMDAAYHQLMQPFPKIVMVSAVVYLVVQYVDNRLFSWMRTMAGDRYFMARVLFSLIFSQVLDTVLFSLYALGDIAASLWDIIVFSSLVKILCSGCMVFNTAISQRLSGLWQKISQAS
jgi:queuosine precursor transporter